MGHIDNAKTGIEMFAHKPDLQEVFQRSRARLEAELADIEARIAKREGK